MMKKIKSLLMGLTVVAISAPVVFAQPTSSQQAGGTLRQQTDIESQDFYGKRIQRWPSKKKEEAAVPEEPVQEDALIPKVTVNEVQFEGIELLSQKDLDELLTQKFTAGQEMTFNQMRALAADVTALYRQKGFVTSRAYIPPQDLEKGILTIKALEGRMGRYTISGNKNFTTQQLEKKFRIKQGDVFDYNELQKSIENINRIPDRDAKIILVPGEQPGETDVNVQVQDSFPGHITLEYDNWASQYLNHSRMGITLEHNNVTKHDDRLSLKFLFSEGYNLHMWQGRYAYPLTNTLEVGAHFMTSDTHLSRAFESLNANGDADVVGVFAVKELVNRPDVTVNLNAGFDLKNVKNYLLGSLNSEDKVRVGRIGLDIDHDDLWGRSIAGIEWDFGIPGLWNAMDRESDPLASRSGAGAEFNKGIVNFFRLQPLPSDIKYLNESYLLWKNLGQYSNDVLVSSEQFQIGGATSVRAYGPGERSGDTGLLSSLEWSFPVYGLSRDIKLPGKSQEKLYDALRLVAFYDIGWTDLKNPQAGEKEKNTLRGYGIGVRLNIKQDVAFRVEIAWPDGKKSDDGRSAHTWVELDCKF